MSHWFSSRARRWALMMIGIAFTLLAVGLSYRYAWNAASWRFSHARDREADAAAMAQGREHLRQGRPRLAIQAVSHIREESPEGADALTIQGLAFASLEEVGPARQVLERAWRRGPNAMAAKVLAAVYLGANETDRGLRMLQAAAKIAPDDFRPWYAMGESVHMPRRRFDDAALAFRESLKRLPDHLESRIGLIDALIKAHRLEEAEPLLGIMSRERPDDLKVLVLTARLTMSSGHEQDAERCLEQILMADPQHREALLLRSRLRFQKRRSQDALDDAERALALAPPDLEALNLLGSIQSALGLKEKAAVTFARRRQVEQQLELIRDLTHQVVQRPADAEPRWRLGRAAALAGMKPLASQCFHAALALAPQCQEARQGLRELDLR